MVIEIALIIVIMILVFTEFLKYAVMPHFGKDDMYYRCLHAKETFL
jgi:hypothetical protein